MGKTNIPKLKGYVEMESGKKGNNQEIKEILAEMAILYLRNKKEIEKQ